MTSQSPSFTKDRKGEVFENPWPSQHHWMKCVSPRYRGQRETEDIPRAVHGG